MIKTRQQIELKPLPLGNLPSLVGKTVIWKATWKARPIYRLGVVQNVEIRSKLNNNAKISIMVTHTFSLSLKDDLPLTEATISLLSPVVRRLNTPNLPKFTVNARIVEGFNFV